MPINIRVSTHYLPQQSRDGLWVFAYDIMVINGTSEAVQLLDRHWKITDAEGHAEDVRGPGVVGQQPVIAPGEHFTYQSGCPLRTPVGVMQGSYGFIEPDTGRRFRVTIAPFRLAMPGILN